MLDVPQGDEIGAPSGPTGSRLMHIIKGVKFRHSVAEDCGHGVGSSEAGALRSFRFRGETTGEHEMKKYVPALAAAAMLLSMNCASAAPLSGALALKNVTPSDILTVGGWGGGHSWGGGPGWRGGLGWRGGPGAET
jgi:hypothetical protein